MTIVNPKLYSFDEVKNRLRVSHSELMSLGVLQVYQPHVDASGKTFFTDAQVDALHEHFGIERLGKVVKEDKLVKLSEVAVRLGTTVERLTHLANKNTMYMPTVDGEYELYLSQSQIRGLASRYEL